MWPYMKVKVIQTGIKMQSLVKFIIIPSLKDIRWEASKCKPILKHTLFKTNKTESSTTNMNHVKEN